MDVSLGTSKCLKPGIRNDADFRMFLTAEKMESRVGYLCFKPLLRRSRFNSQVFYMLATRDSIAVAPPYGMVYHNLQTTLLCI